MAYVAEGNFDAWSAAGDAALRRVVQVVGDLARKPVDQLRVLDLACYEGQYAIEFALHGAEVVGIEGRDVNIERARARAATHGLERLEFVKADVRDLSRKRFGAFDVVLCLGILYHIDFPDVLRLLDRIGEVCEHHAVFDTHITFGLTREFRDGSRAYRGRAYIEHSAHADSTEREQSTWASLDNTRSVWFTHASTINAILDSGFSSVYECEAPADVAKTIDRRTFVAVKGQSVKLRGVAGSEHDTRVPERRSRALLLRNHAPGTNLLKRFMLDVDRLKQRRNETPYGPRSFGRRN
jgi:SAM-dependent methyltransferase